MNKDDVRFTVILSHDLHRRAKVAAAAREITLASVVRECLVKLTEALPEDTVERRTKEERDRQA